MMGFPLILLLACCMNTSLCKMSEKEKDGDEPHQECGGSDVEMDSQLVDDEGAVEAKKIRVEVEGASPATERVGDEEEEMSQDGGDTNQDVDTVVPGNDEAGGGGGRGEGKEEIANEEEEDMSQDGGETSSGDDERREHGGEGKVAQPADGGGDVMSQGEGDPCNNQTELTQHQDTEPAEAYDDNQVGDEGGLGEGKVEESTGAAGGLDEEVKPKAEGMAPQGSCSGSDAEDSDSEIPQFPKTLEGFGYHFKEGKLLSIDGDKPFVFEVRRGKKKFNQAHYEALGEVITGEVYKMLETEAQLKKVSIPSRLKRGEPSSFIFRSDDALTNKDKLMILIHGSGVVRAGQWARSLIINDCIDSGTQIPYIKKAIEEHYGVIVLNTNYNTDEPRDTPIRGSSSSREHAQYVWKEFVKGAKAKRIYIVAHSFGGVVTVDLMVARFSEFKNRVQKIAFTDSVHTLPSRSVSQKAQKWIIKHAVNWVTSDRPVNEELEPYPNDVKRRSAGTLKHVETSWFSFEHIFAYFREK